MPFSTTYSVNMAHHAQLVESRFVLREHDGARHAGLLTNRRLSPATNGGGASSGWHLEPGKLELAINEARKDLLLLNIILMRHGVGR